MTKAEPRRKHRNRGGWTPKALAYLAKAEQAIERLHEYWPLTLRQVYYQLVASGDVANKIGEYRKLSGILVKARLDGKVPWTAMEDRSRSLLESDGWRGFDAFVEDELDRFLVGYRRDLLAGQEVVPEVWIEKDALSRICHDVALPYCVPVVVARGFSSVSYVDECRRRIVQTAEEGGQTMILYFGDLDPSGWEMLPSMLETIQTEMGLRDAVDSRRCALTPEQATALDLPYSVDAMKPKDPRTPKFKAMLRANGWPDNLAVELDSLQPATLQRFVKEAIETTLDMNKFTDEQEAEQEDIERLDVLRERVCDAVAAMAGEL